MKFHYTGVPAILAAILAGAAAAQSASPAPAFEAAYRAWDVVTDIARHNRDPNISGDCGKTFRPFVVPGLRRQTKQDQGLAAAACVAAARSVCANGKLQRTGDMARKCEEFR
jgi:hypothetical protein